MRIKYTQKFKHEPWEILPNGFTYSTQAKAEKAAEYWADDGSNRWKKISIYNKDGTLKKAYKFRVIVVTQREKL